MYYNIHIKHITLKGKEKRKADAPIQFCTQSNDSINCKKKKKQKETNKETNNGVSSS